MSEKVKKAIEGLAAAIWERPERVYRAYASSPGLRLDRPAEAEALRRTA